jgi:Ca-activated chloride channel family protein
MKRNFWLALLAVLFVSGFLPKSARADGIIIPEPPICRGEVCPPPPCPGPGLCPPPTPSAQLAVRYHHVTVTVQDQVAITHIDQVFYNPNDWQVEGTYYFPLPKDATVSSFTLWVDGKPVQGQVLNAEQARHEYEDIVRSLRDPALLEYADRGAVRASIFPIPPGGERRIELEYAQALSADNGLVSYVYPLNTEKFSALPLDNVTVNVDIRSSRPIRAVYSPTHNIAVNRIDEFHVTAGYEASDVRPDNDFALYYSVGENEAFHLISTRDPREADPDGYFLLLLAPRPDASAERLPKDVILVLDRSGSMEGEKFSQAQDALRYVLNHLNPEDRFNIITFSTGVEAYATSLRPAVDAKEALPWVDRLSAQGSTDINRALLEAVSMVDPERPAYLIFLTDGLPTEGEVDSQKILDNLTASAPDNLRLFAFGVGYDVDTFLLDSLSLAHHGASTYVQPGERLDETISGFYAKISTPVLTNLSLDFNGISTYDLYPSPLPDLFTGSQIIVVGRYRGGGTAEVNLSGEVHGQVQTFRFPEQRFESDTASNSQLSAIPRLWATRKIGYLLNQIRLQGPDQETVDQIVRLSIRFGIVTPYTSYLVSESAPLGAAEQDRIASEQYNQLQSMAPAPAYGQEAVEKAAGQGALADAEAPAAPLQDSGNTVRIVGSRTFVLSDGVWVDTGFDPERMPTIKVPFLSADYFALAGSRPMLADAFALGQRVIVLLDGKAYEVVGSEETTPPVELPPTLSPSTTAQPSISTPQPLPTFVSQPLSRNEGLPCSGGLALLALVPVTYLMRIRRE